MRIIAASRVEETVYRMALEAGRTPAPGLVPALEKALSQESSPSGQQVLKELLENIRVSAQTGLALCQDTGMAVVFVQMGEEVFVEGSLTEAIEKGIRRGYEDGCYRASVLDPITRINTRDNTPAMIHMEMIPGDKLMLDLAPKGAGSENKSRQAMLNPSQGMEGVENFVLQTVEELGAYACPPLVVGVGIGGNFEKSCELAKRALIQPFDVPNPRDELAALESRLLRRINRLGIGPMGMGGNTTALAVHALAMPTHIAQLPVAVNLQCHCLRHSHGVL